MWASLNKAPPSNWGREVHRPSTASSSSTSLLEPPPRYSADQQGDFHDPRASSQHSLVPSDDEFGDEQRRKLLVIYIHGFNGNSQSFRSFPAHVHNYLKNALSDTHVVHTKLYPRYKTYRAVEVARDKFSEWLEPHEGPNVDVILVGHSMGGILAADVILIPNLDPNAEQPFKHRILGHVSLDCPFLGLHPGIVVSGIASLFQSSPKPPEDPTWIEPRGRSQSQLDLANGAAGPDGGSSPYSTLPPEPRKPDPNFNAPFFNDKTYEEKPFLKSVFSFVKKHHAEGIANSFAQRLMDQLEFGGCLADYPGMHARYKKLRALEDVDEIKMLSEGHPPGAHAQVRFVNYYTLSSGVQKKPKTPEEEDSDADDEGLVPAKDDGADRLEVDPLNDLSTDGGVSTPRSDISIKVEDHSGDSPAPRYDNEKGSSEKRRSEVDFSRLSMQDIDPTPMSDSDQPSQPHQQPAQPTQSMEQSSPAEPAVSVNLQRTATEEPALPPLPEDPTPPVLPDLDAYTDKASRKQAEKESKRLQKAYEQAVKDRAKAVREREKLVEKRRKDAQKALSKQERQDQKKLDTHEKREKQRLQKEEQRMEKEKQRLEKEAERMKRKAAGKTTSAQASQQSLEQVNMEELSDEEEELRRAMSEDPQTSHPDTATAAAAAAPKKRKKFCTLPRKVNGKHDETWVDIYMENMNEVTAHCGLFFAGPHYERLVGDVGSRIVGWVHDDLTKKAVLDMAVD